MEVLEFQEGNASKSPQKEWIDSRQGRLEPLGHNTKSANFASKELLGTIELEPVRATSLWKTGKLSK
jgi:hypothetical protein